MLQYFDSLPLEIWSYRQILDTSWFYRLRPIFCNGPQAISSLLGHLFEHLHAALDSQVANIFWIFKNATFPNFEPTKRMSRSCQARFRHSQPLKPIKNIHFWWNNAPKTKICMRPWIRRLPKLSKSSKTKPHKPKAINILLLYFKLSNFLYQIDRGWGVGATLGWGLPGLLNFLIYSTF